MSLRARVLAWIGVVLVLCLGLGFVFAGRHAAQSVRVELAAALAGGVRDVRDLSPRLPALSDPAHAYADLATSFGGARHLRVTLLGKDGRLLAASRPMATAHPAPRWFAALLAPRLAPTEIKNQTYTLRLEPVSDNEISEVWVEFRDDMLVLAMVFVGAAGAIYLTLGQALAPLKTLAAGFAEVMDGDTDVRAPEQGPPELASLARAFNRMAERLGETRRRNARLEEQVLTLQEEERAELARDLHDEIGPHLFAMKVDAAVIGEEAAGQGAAAITARVQSMTSSIAHIQSSIRDLLGRLRPTPLAQLGLGEALEELLDFWRGRQPDIVFSSTVAVDETGLSPSRRAALYRLVQEGLSNAVRHAHATLIEVAVAVDADGDLVASVTDNGPSAPGPIEAPGMGLTGMRERVMTSGGALSIGRGPGGEGWDVRARWPGAAEPSIRIKA